MPSFAALGNNDLLSFFFSSRRRHTRLQGDWSSDVCSSDLAAYDGGMPVVDVSNPSIPRRVTTYATRADAVAVAVAGNYAYVSGDGLEIIEIIEIGRASCRGRGEISVVAGSLKKKKIDRVRE